MTNDQRRTLVLCCVVSLVVGALLAWAIGWAAGSARLPAAPEPARIVEEQVEPETPRASRAREAGVPDEPVRTPTRVEWGTIHVTVMTDDGLWPVAGARVECGPRDASSSERKLTTNAQGIAVFTSQPDVPSIVRASGDVDAPPEAAFARTEVEVPGAGRVVLRLPRISAVRLHVQDEEGTPYDGTVAVHRRLASAAPDDPLARPEWTNAEDGVVELRLPHALHVVRVSVPGTIGSEEVQVAPGGQEPTLTLREGASASGVVVDMDGNRVPDANVSVVSDRAGDEFDAPRDTTDHTGAFRIDGLTPGVPHLLIASVGVSPSERVGHATWSGDEQEEMRIVVGPSVTVRVRIEMPPDAHPQLAADRWLRLRSWTDAGWRPAARAYASEGGASFSGVLPGRVEVTSLPRNAGLYLPEPLVADVHGGETLVLKVAAFPVVRGRLVFEGARRGFGAVVAAGGPPALVAPDGTFAAQAFAPGTVRLVWRADGWRDVPLGESKAPGDEFAATVKPQPAW